MPAPLPQMVGSPQAAVAVGAETTFFQTINPNVKKAIAEFEIWKNITWFQMQTKNKKLVANAKQ